MLEQLEELRESLPEAQKTRLKVLVHDCLPMGSAILLDATSSTGKIQVETKLYRAPRTESFGYEVVGPTPFYSRNYSAWKRVLDDSKEVSSGHLQAIQMQVAKALSPAGATFVLPPTEQARQLQ